MAQKTDIPGIYKEEEGVFLNKDESALSAYKKRKRKFREMDEMKEEIKDMKSDIAEIKDLLKKLVN